VSSDHSLRNARQDNRNEYRAHTRARDTARARMLQRIVAALVQLQQYEPHAYHGPEVRVSPRRCMDVPDIPGGQSSDFEGTVS
jgi:hypothetical protein